MDEKTIKAIGICLGHPYIKWSAEEKKIQATIAAKIVSNEIFSIMKENNLEIADLGLMTGFKSVVRDLVVLRSLDIITPKHMKEILSLAWSYGQDTIDILRDTKILEEAEAGELDIHIKAVFDENPAIIEEYKGGKVKVIGFLVGNTMKKLSGKGNPQEIKSKIENMLNS
jgi:aspartyl-tRNA(Asn)/glutamyl-tRNA(Gln) amidotransferase subunit B